MKILIIFLAFIFSAHGPGNRAEAADPATNPSLSCPNAEIFSAKLFTDICWACIFPIRVAGVSITPGEKPDGSSDLAMCLCKNKIGIFLPGIVNAMWEPARLIEVVRKPGCSMALGGAQLPLGDKRQWGTQNTSVNGDIQSSESLSYYNIHYYSFPLLTMLELYMPKKCSADGYGDFDIIQLTEIDPTWNNSELAFFTHPESAAVANPIAQAACTADAALGLANKQPLTSLWWCAGTWGSIYPMSGAAIPNDFARTTSLLSARTVGQMHRRGMAHLTMGDDTLCRGQIFPTIPKGQYKFAMFTPRPETKRAHMYGSHPMTWQGGEGRVIPKVGEDALYMMFRWNDCCNTLGSD